MKAVMNLPFGTLEVEGETQKELFEEMARAAEVFGEQCCGLCKSNEVRPVFRVVGSGKETFEYCEWHCMNPACRARLSLSQNMKGGTLYPIRKLTPEGQPATGDLAEKGVWDTKGKGWTKFKGKPKE